MTKQYNSTAATVSAIWKSRVEINHAFVDRAGSAQKIKNPKYPEINDALLEWFEIQWKRNIPIDGALLREKATSIARDLRMIKFVCSSSWITRFKSRNSITYGSIQAESKSVNEYVVSTWLTEQWTILRYGYLDTWKFGLSGIYCIKIFNYKFFKKISIK